MSQPWRTSSIAASLAILVCVPSATEGQAAFADGVWLGNAVALGPIDAPDGTWNGRVEAWFDLFVDQGAVQGDVTVSAAGTANIRSNPPGVIRQAGSGSGTAQGSPSALQFTGSINMTHVAISSHTGGRTAVVRSSTDPLSIRVRITSATCTDVEGEWIQDWNAMSSQRGYTTPLHGTFAAVRQDAAAFAAFADSWNSTNPGTPSNSPTTPLAPGTLGRLPASIMAIANANLLVTKAWRAYLQLPQSSAELLPVLQGLFQLRALINSLDECSKSLLGDKAIRTMLRQVAEQAGAAIGTWAQDVATGREVRMLVGYGETLGAWDPALNPNAATHESELRVAAESLLEPYVQQLYANAPGIVVHSDFESRQLVDSAEFMGWSFNYGGHAYRGSELKASLR